ncbi:LysM peptidoglycan-binding domain-containing protein [Desulfonatronovibrio hydrogenovorans]|uniref:LysM peptidoglycan-binding domain-containing protein n=1 Tax=Desulfonatronovibrio hydrogenovorans TaxID=53245 RepID=UPI00048F439E|nr:LysM peptidoglycan-binding domain-containing protein [Desulfonatronovibrio hydrogenovorans]
MKRYLLLAILLLAMVGFGCAKKPVTPEPEPPKEEVKVEAPAPTPAPEPTPAPQPTAREIYERNYSMLPTSHTVVKGECLWWIAEYQQIYNDPFMWPLIYKANRDKIRNPDLIYPGQVFQIPRAFQLDEVKESRRSAGAPRPYLPPQAATLPADIRAELGWSF